VTRNSTVRIVASSTVGVRHKPGTKLHVFARPVVAQYYVEVRAELNAQAGFIPGKHPRYRLKGRPDGLLQQMEMQLVILVC
jgi:hypothetical protein